MKRYFHAFAMCQSMFCAIPFPCKVWDEDARGEMLLFLPIVGLEIGAIWALMGWMCVLLHLPVLVRALVLAVCPYMLTGFLHLDGFMDVTDAVKSCRSLERRREILKDSHVGAFAVIGIAVLLLSQFALLASVPEDAPYGVLAAVCAVSRCCSALAVTGLKPMSTSQYASRKARKSHLAALVVMLLIFLGGSFLLWGRYVLVPLGCLAGCAFSIRKGYRSLEGMNGDISGYALTLGELCAVAVMAIL